MSVVLDIPSAQRLAGSALAECGAEAPLVTIVVIRPGGAQVAVSHNAGERQMPRASLVRELGIMAVAARADITELPADWLARQPQSVYPSPQLTGAIVRFYALNGQGDEQRRQCVGVIGLVGIGQHEAYEILTKVITGNNFLLAPELS